MMHVLAREASVGYIVCGNGFILASLSCAHASMICSRISCTAMHECAALFILSVICFQPMICLVKFTVSVRLSPKESPGNSKETYEKCAGDGPKPFVVVNCA